MLVLPRRHRRRRRLQNATAGGPAGGLLLGVVMGVVVGGLAMWGCFRAKVGGARDGVTVRTGGGTTSAVKVNLA